MLLSNQQQRDIDLDRKLEDFAEGKCEYAQFCTNAMHISRGLHGSSMPEKKYSRTLRHLKINDSRQAR